MEDTLQQSVFLKACRREKTPYTPVWLMRQAGRYMKDYRELRDKMSFLDLCKKADLAAEVTVGAQQRLKADAAIIFSDILLILEPMGLAVNYLKNSGPSIVPAMTDASSVDRLKSVRPEESLSFVMDAIRLARKGLNDDIPLIGFSGAPFTLASYMIESGPSKEFVATRKFMHADITRWDVLMTKLARACQDYLNAQIDAGTQVVQLFDSWVGILTSEEYETFVLPYSRRLIAGIKKGVPVIHFGTRTEPFLEQFAQAGGDVLGVDHRVGLDDAWKRIGPDKAIQGNLDPVVLCASLDEIQDQVKRVLLEARGRPGHIFNLGHGILPETPEMNAITLIDMVHELSRA